MRNLCKKQTRNKSAHLRKQNVSKIKHYITKEDNHYVLALKKNRSVCITYTHQFFPNIIHTM